MTKGNRGLVLLLTVFASVTAEAGQPVQRLAPFQQNGQSRDGRSRWSIVAAALETYDHRDRQQEILGRLEQFHVELTPDGPTVCSLEGQQAELDRQGRLVLRGNVLLQAKRDGYRLQTHSLRYLPRTQSVTSPDKVIIQTPSLTVESIGLIIRLPEQTCRLVEHVRLIEQRREWKARTLVWELRELGVLGPALQMLSDAYREGLQSILQHRPLAP